MLQVLERGDSVLNGELVLPSGLTLPLGAMIVALRRKEVMKDILLVRGGGYHLGDRIHPQNPTLCTPGYEGYPVGESYLVFDVRHRP